MQDSNLLYNICMSMEWCLLKFITIINGTLLLYLLWAMALKLVHEESGKGVIYMKKGSFLLFTS